MPLREKIRGALVGAALGDAWGAPVDKLMPLQIRQQYGKVDSLDVEHDRLPSRTHGKGLGRFADNTLMNMLLCQVYQELGAHPDAYSVFPLIRKIYFEEIWVPEYQKKMPLIERLFYAADPRGAYQEVIAYAAAHQTSYGLEAAGVFAACVAAAMIEGITLEEIVNQALGLAKDGTQMAIRAVVEALPEIRQAKDPA